MSDKKRPGDAMGNVQAYKEACERLMSDKPREWNIFKGNDKHRVLCSGPVPGMNEEVVRVVEASAYERINEELELSKSIMAMIRASVGLLPGDRVSLVKHVGQLVKERDEARAERDLADKEVISLRDEVDGFEDKLTAERAKARRLVKALSRCATVAHSYDNKPYGFERVTEIVNEALSECTADLSQVSTSENLTIFTPTECTHPNASFGRCPKCSPPQQSKPEFDEKAAKEAFLHHQGAHFGNPFVKGARWQFNQLYPRQERGD